MMPRNPIEADWLIRSAEEEAARAERWAAVAQQQMAYQAAMAKAHAADAAGLRALWTFVPLSTPGSVDQSNRPEPAVVIDVPAPEPVEPPRCQFCGKPTRIWQGKPQRFCSFSKTAIGYSCAHRWRDRRDTEIRQKAKAEAQRERAEIQAVDLPDIAFSEVVPITSEAPTCRQCGKPTRIWKGKPQKFCSPPVGHRVSPCASAFNFRARQAKANRSPAQRVRRARKQPEPVRPTGSVLVTASPRADGHDLLTTVTRAVSASLPNDLRSEIISETVVLMLEGAKLADAIAEASKNVRRNAAPLRYTKPINDCFWLAAEPSG